ncbi:hypothetical protein NKH48_31350 [Mesorhizobium sp. M1233]|uniref:hypothetical protein n=1 Tax=Mesorhizobium sp. M1233 TaxID=2957072 RepID=UPI00333AA72F
MINLQERLSEYSYGFGVTRETLALMNSVGLSPTPFLPNLLHEKEIGFDVGFKDKGRVVILQFKLGHLLERFKRASPSQSIPDLDRPFWRFNVDTSVHQFLRLAEFEAAGAEAYYVAPKLSTWKQFERAFQADKIMHRSVLIKPSEIAAGIAAHGHSAGPHRIVYDQTRQYVCSEPSVLPHHRPEEFAADVATKVRESGIHLEYSIKVLYERARDRNAAGTLADSRARQIFGRARDRLSGMAAIIGLEAWSQGAQVLFITDPKS